MGPAHDLLGKLVVTTTLFLMTPLCNPFAVGFGVEQAPYGGMQTSSYPKGGLLDGICPSTMAPGVLSSEQDFQMFPKSRLSTVGVNYCSVGQDFTGSNLNLLASSSGKMGTLLQPGNGIDLGMWALE